MQDTEDEIISFLCHA